MRPSKIKELKVIMNHVFPFTDNIIMLFGILFMKNKSQDYFERYKKTIIGKTHINHYMIHVKEACSLNDSWLVFYIKYFIYWLKNNPFINGFDFASKFNPFEIEAFMHENDLDYLLDKENGCFEWLEFEKIPIKEKKLLYDLYMSEEIRFDVFLKTHLKKFNG